MESQSFDTGVVAHSTPPASPPPMDQVGDGEPPARMDENNLDMQCGSSVAGRKDVAAWGSLKSPQKNSAPKKRAFDPLPKVDVAKMSRYHVERKPVLESPLNWSFYLHPSAVLLNEEPLVIGRKSENRGTRANFYYLAKKTTNGCSSIKISEYEAKRKLIPFLETQLECIRWYIKDEDREDMRLIPLFKENPDRAFEMDSGKKKGEFWNTPDLKLVTVEIRLIFNQLLGEFELLIHSPVSEEIMEKYPGFTGPTLYFTPERMETLLNFFVNATTT